MSSQHTCWKVSAGAVAPRSPAEAGCQYASLPAHTKHHLPCALLWHARRQRGYVTLFTYVTTTTKGVYAAIAKRVPRQYRPQVRSTLS